MRNVRFNFFTFITTVICTFLFIACQEDKEPETLSVTPTRLTFSADDSEEKSVTIKTNASSWSYNQPDNWVEVYKKSENDKLYFKVNKHTDTQSARSSNITVTAGKTEPVQVTITQSASEANSLTVDPTTISFGANETGTKIVTVTTNATSWFSTNQIDGSWITLTERNNTLEITVSTANTTTTERTTRVQITAGTAPVANLMVRQAGINTLSASPSSLSFEAGETGEKTATITTNASSWNATTDATWVQLTKQNNLLSINVTETNENSSSRSANIRLTAGDAAPVTLSVVQAGRSTTTYNTAEGIYFGNDAKTGTALFYVNLFNSSQPSTGLQIAGFCTLPSSGFSDFKLTAGTYTPSSTGGAVRTFILGLKSSDNHPMNTYVYDYTNKKTILVTGGSFMVETSGNNYTITTNLTGEEYDTGIPVSNIRVKYSGPITFENKSSEDPAPPFGEFSEKTFNGTGTPKFLSTPGPKSWMGKITPMTSDQGNYYKISSWGGKDIPVYLNYKNGKIIMDGATKVTENYDTNIKGYFKPIVLDYSKGEWEEVPKYEVRYDESMQAIHFGGTYNGREILVGIVALRGNGLELVGAFSDLYSGARILFTNSFSAPQFSGNAVKLSIIPNSNILLIGGKTFKKKENKEIKK